MKTLISISLLFVLTNISAQEYEYLDVEVRGSDNVYVDDGSGYEVKGLGKAKSTKKDNGEKFLGPIDVLVYYEAKGYELYKCSAMSEMSIQVRVYLFRRPRVTGYERGNSQMLGYFQDTAKRKNNANVMDLKLEKNLISDK